MGVEYDVYYKITKEEAEENRDNVNSRSQEV